MKRSTGITVTAVLVLVGSGFTLLAAFFAALVFALRSVSGSHHGLPRVFGWLAVFYYLALAAWGIATGVALLKVREWGRISHLIFSALLAFGCLGAACVMPFINFPTPPNDLNPAFTHQIMLSVKFGLVFFYGALGALGVWWLYFFSKRSVREEFGAPQLLAPATPGFAAPPPVHTRSFTLPASTVPSARPVSISIIAVLLLFGALSLPISLLARAPLLIAGFLVSGWQAIVLVTTLSLANVAAGVGLFKLKLWARSLAIGLVVFALINILLTVLIPGSQSRWDQLMHTIFENWGLPSTLPIAPVPLWLTMLPAIPVAFAELYFLITRKPAFLARPEGQ